MEVMVLLKSTEMGTLIMDFGNSGSVGAGSNFAGIATFASAHIDTMIDKLLRAAFCRRKRNEQAVSGPDALAQMGCADRREGGRSFFHNAPR
jgi:hypothetical protein